MEVNYLQQTCADAANVCKRKGDVVHSRCLALTSLMAQDKDNVVEVVEEMEVYINNLVSLRRAIIAESIFRQAQTE